ncbi:MAG TPA: cytochrome c3 family protein, partial [Steroidobacteraceae bacterium]
HIPVIAGTDCSACHITTGIAVGGFANTMMNAAKHAFVATTCDTCHEAGLTFYPGAALNLQGRPNSGTFNHLTSTDPNQVSGDCSLCHNVNDWASNVPPVGHMPNPANNACATCHTTPSSTPGTPDYTQYSIAGVHTGSIVGSCDICHSGASWIGSPARIMPKPSTGLSPAHIPVIAGADCSGCHITTGIAVGGFAGTTMSAAKHAFVATTCDTCHEAGLSFYPGAALNLQGRPADHTSVSEAAPNDCSGCHETTDWNSTALPAGHMPNPGNQTCNICHTAAPSNYTTLAANPVLHTGITSGCISCHGSTAALTFYNNFTPKSAVLTPSHIPWLTNTTPCEDCHSTTSFTVGGFGPITMTQATHAFVASTCNTCHEAGVVFYMGSSTPALQGRPADHTSGQMVAPNQCSICHTTTNWNSTALPAGHMPNPASQACSLCHTTAPADYSTATLAANAILHTGITSGCITCHGGPAGALTFYNNFTPKSAVLSPVHIPTSTTPCEDCHTATVFTAFSGTTMSSAKHTSMFTVIGKSCDACHNAVTPPLSFYGVNNLTTRPSNHSSGSKLTNDCSSCHGTNNWDDAAQKKVGPAKVVPGSVIGTVAPAPPATGSPLLVPVRGPVAPVRSISHAGVTASCVSCHNGTLATGKGPNHIASNNQCENCHTTIAWLPARFDHQGVNGACASCHNGVVASGKPLQHMVTSQDCGACHSTIAWLPVRFNHQGISGTCQSCHNGLTASGKPLQHVATTLDCSSCHNTQTWSVIAPPPVMTRPGAAPPRGATVPPVK